MARVARSGSVEVISKVQRTAVRCSLHRLVRWRRDYIWPRPHLVKGHGDDVGLHHATRSADRLAPKADHLADRDKVSPNLTNRSQYFEHLCGEPLDALLRGVADN